MANKNIGTFTVDVELQPNGLLDVYTAHEGSSGCHYTDVTPDRVGEIVAGDIEAVLESSSNVNSISLLLKVKDYIMSDTKRKEDFTDVEICCEEDNEFANIALGGILSNYTLKNCQDFLAAMKRNASICEGGWIENGERFPK